VEVDEVPDDDEPPDDDPDDPPDDVDEVDVPALEEPEDDELESDPDDSALDSDFDSPDAVLAAALVLEELPRSFFAQPDPLKWIAGAANCLRMDPSAPHDGQKFGPGSLIPWRMSARWSQAVQR
jgi:hypothetical protein